MSNNPANSLNGVVIAVDFDGTCVAHEYPKIGRHIGAPRVLHRIVKEGGKLILWTMRTGKPLEEAVAWFEEHGIPLFGIQRNPTQDEWTDSPKAYANIYIDDVALGCPLKQGLTGERPFVDWNAVEALLWSDDEAPVLCAGCDERLVGHEDENGTHCRWCVTGWTACDESETADAAR
jgi:hypothetical protein